MMMSENGDTNIAGYSLIGNCRSAALVSKYGSIDWCCLPEFHSSSIFAALLDRKKGGYFSIHPIHDFKSKPQYLDQTNIVETIFENDEGKVRLVDGFTAMEEEDKATTLFPDHEIMRIIEGISGAVNLKMEIYPRTNYGNSSPRLEVQGKLGIQFFYKENIFIFQSTLEDSQIKVIDEKVITEFIVREGEKIIFSLSCSGQCPAIIPEIRSTGWERMLKTIHYWKSWSGKCKYNGVFKEQVIRSVLALKLLTHAPSGAIIAAPTTSLPEEVGGVRNWDYRYCWLRDASFTIRVLVKLGYHDEAHAYMNWILHATRLTRPRLQVVYTVFGHSKITEKCCKWLTGYKDSRPVRVGNAAHEQFQLDVYGEILDAVYTYSHLLREFDYDTRNFIIELGKVICRLWDKPDVGIWEIRSSSVQHTHSKVMAWVGLERLIRLCRKYNWNKAPVHKFEETRDKIFQQIEQEGFNKSLGHYTREFNGISVDASLLILSLVDYCEADSFRMKSTREAVQRHLQKNSFIYRYQNIDDGLPGKEGAFFICNFWFIENLAIAGSVKEASDLFLETVKHTGTSGLFSEEIDPDTKELLGNYPQGFSHIGLINAAIAIEEANQLKANSV